MEHVLLVRGYASDDMILWFMTIALICTIFGGRWLMGKTGRFIRHRRELHLWPFR